jgi:hypothetical protein
MTNYPVRGALKLSGALRCLVLLPPQMLTAPPRSLRVMLPNFGGTVPRPAGHVSSWQHGD